RTAARQPSGSLGHALFGEGFEVAAGGLHVWRATLDPEAHPWLLEHRAGGAAVLPAAAILDAVSFAGRALGLGAAVNALTFEQRMEIAADREVQLIVQPTGRVDLYARTAGAPWQRHAHGQL